MLSSLYTCCIPVFPNILQTTFILEANILAHRIRISEILPWDRKSYLTHAILSRLSSKVCTLIVLELTHMVVKRCHCYIKGMSSCEIASQRIQGFLEAYFNIKNNGEQEKESGSPFVITRQASDAKRWSWGRIFLSYPHTHDRFL